MLRVYSLMLLFHPLPFLRHLALSCLLLLFWLLSSPLLPGQSRGTSRAFDALSSASSTPSFQVTLNQGAAASSHAVQLVVTSTPSACSFTLDGSLNNTTFLALATAVDCTVAANRLFHITGKPVNRIRGTLATLTATTKTTSDCTNASPIEVTTTANHGLTTGDKVTITGVTGNTACNVTNTAITVTAADKFTVAVAGNGVYGGVGTVVTVPTVQLIYLGTSQ